MSDEDLEFLRWYSKIENTAISSMYRQITLNSYREFRLSVLTAMYTEGKIGFKQFCRKANISFTQGLKIIEEQKIDPPITENMDDYTNKVRDQIIESLEKTDEENPGYVKS